MKVPSLGFSTKNQKIPLEMEWDEADQTALHAVAYNTLGQAIGTARLLEHTPEIAKVGRMAVKRVLRGSSIGSRKLPATRR